MQGVDIQLPRGLARHSTSHGSSDFTQRTFTQMPQAITGILQQHAIKRINITFQCAVFVFTSAYYGRSIPSLLCKKLQASNVLRRHRGAEVQSTPPKHLFKGLQQDHSHTRDHSANDVQSEAEDTSAGLSSEKAGSSALRVGSSAGATRLDCRAGNDTGAISTSRLEQISAAGAGRLGNRRLGCGLAFEAAAIWHSLGVGVDGERQLLLVRAHAVGPVRALGRVLVDARAVRALVLATDEVEHGTIFLLFDFVGNSAAKGVHHAGAGVVVDDGRKRAGDCLPLSGSDAGAGRRGGVGGVVVGHLDTGGGDFSDLLGQVGEVIVGFDSSAANCDETYSVSVLGAGI
jgi:hypothetical protein